MGRRRRSPRTGCDRTPLQCASWAISNSGRWAAGSTAGSRTAAWHSGDASGAAVSADEDAAKVRLGPWLDPQPLFLGTPYRQSPAIRVPPVGRIGRVAGVRELTGGASSDSCVNWRRIRVRLTAPARMHEGENRSWAWGILRPGVWFRLSECFADRKRAQAI